MIKERNKFLKEAMEEDSSDKYVEYRILRNKISKRLETDRTEYYRTKFYQENPSISSIWRSANDYLNSSKRSFSNTPSIIKFNGQVLTSPRDVANALNDTFLKKVSDLRSTANSSPRLSPIQRLRKYLDKKETGIRELSLRKKEPMLFYWLTQATLSTA